MKIRYKRTDLVVANNVPVTTRNVNCRRARRAAKTAAARLNKINRTRWGSCDPERLEAIRRHNETRWIVKALPDPPKVWRVLFAFAGED